MNAAEIVKRKMQIHSSPKILDLSRKSVSQARETAKLHSYGQVLPFHVAGGDVLGIGISAADLGYNLRDLSWGVALISLLAIVAVELRKLREIGIASEGLFDSLAVEDVGIGSQLDAMISDPAPDITHESLGILAGSFANQECGNELSVRVQSDENPLVAELCRIALPDVSRFFHQERPDFIALETAAGQLAHFFVHQLFAAFAREYQQAHDGVSVQARESFRGADRAAFKKALQRSCSGVRCGSHRTKRRSGLRFTEGYVAGLAAPALDAALTKVPESLAGLVLASGAGHVISPLALCEETSQNRFSRSMAWVTPRFGLAPTAARTDAGAHYVRDYPLGWWFDRDFHGVTGSECDLDTDDHAVTILPEGPVHAGLSHLTPKSFEIRRDASPLVEHSFAALRQITLYLPRIHKPLQGGLNRSQRLRVFIKIETRRLKLLPDFSARKRLAATGKNAGNGFRRRGRFPSRGIYLFEDLLTDVFFGHEPYQSSQQNPQLSDSLIRYRSSRDTGFQLLAGI
jgi:hypothetical protein